MSNQEYIHLINKRINALLGLNFIENQWSNLERNLYQAAVSLQIKPDLKEISQWISQPAIEPNQLNLLANQLTVGETYFFREKNAFQLLHEQIIPLLATTQGNQKKKLKIWSAGCSSGEEPYTIAMILRDSIPDYNQWDISILATDINTHALEKAREGVYTPWSFRETADDAKTRFFSPQGKNLVINPEIRSMVKLLHLNLASDDFNPDNDLFRDTDVIFCRNVLMYFLPEAIHTITRKFFHCLNDGGWFITSQVELNDEYFGMFQRNLIGNGIYYSKSAAGKKKDHNKKSIIPEPSVKSPALHFSVKTPQKIKVVKPPARQVDQTQKIPAKTILLKRELEVEVIKLYESAKYTECAVLCEKYLQEQPFDTSLALLLVKAYANAGKSDQAEALVKKLIETDHAGAEYLYIYATILIEKNRWEEADEFLVKTLYLEPKHLAARLSRSQVLRNLRKTAQAEKEILNLMNDISHYDDQDPLPYLEGLTAGRLRQIAGVNK